MKKLSVVVPIFNKEAYLSRCIESIIEQRFSNLELILINDGSTDGSSKICKQYSKQDTRIRLYEIENHGVSYARNLGIEQATGEYIMFVDADDYLPKDSLSLFEKNIDLNEDYDMYVSALNICRCDKNLEAMIRIQTGGYSLREYLIQISHNDMNYNFTGPYAKIIKNNFLEWKDVRFEEGESFGEDFVFNLKLLSHLNRIYCTSEALYNYCIDIPNSLAKASKSTECYFQRYAKISSLWQQLVEKNKCIKECRDDINKFHFLMLKDIVRSVIVDNNIQTNSDKCLKLRQLKLEIQNIEQYPVGKSDDKFLDFIIFMMNHNMYYFLIIIYRNYIRIRT